MKRDIPPIVDFVDPRRVPYDIMDDPRYNRAHPDYHKDTSSFVRQLDERMAVLDAQPRYRKAIRRVGYHWHDKRYLLKPRTWVFRIGGAIARLRRGWNEWDLDQYTPHSLDYLIAACDWHATKSWTYPASYVDGTREGWENTHPNAGREQEGYREDLMKIKSGMLHVKNGLIGNDEKCTCCGDWCKGWTDPKSPEYPGCPIVDEAWTLYTELFLGMWD